MAVNIENMNLELPLRVSHATRITRDVVHHKPTQVKIAWEDDKWVLEETVEEVECSREVVHFEELYEGNEEDQAHLHFDEAVLRFSSTTLRMTQLKDLAKAIGYGFEQENTLSTMGRREIITEMAHSMNRKGLVSNDDVGTFTADILAELKS